MDDENLIGLRLPETYLPIILIKIIDIYSSNDYIELQNKSVHLLSILASCDPF